MCTVTLEYNESNALARRKLAALLATGLIGDEAFENCSGLTDVYCYAEPTQKGFYVKDGRKVMVK